MRAVWAALVAAKLVAGEPAYLVWDLRHQGLEHVSWADSGRSVAAGSLMKPFLALAYYQEKGRYPQVKCTGEDCWREGGHGLIGIVDAVAQSCNFYFRRLEMEGNRAGVGALAQRFGLAAPTEGASLIGLGALWKVSPLDLTKAYAELLARAEEPGVRPILRGMALSGTVGTGKSAGGNVLVKTGTGPCVHAPHGSGDGYAMILYPAETPRKAVLVQLHNAPGAAAAARWPGILAALREKLLWPR